MLKKIINWLKLQAQNILSSDSVKLKVANIRNVMPIVWEILYFMGIMFLILLAVLIVLFIIYLIFKYYGYEWKAFRHFKRR